MPTDDSPPPPQFALVPKSAEQQPVLVNSSSSRSSSNNKSSSKKVRDELVSIYESYAALYPNPNLQAENHERDLLLRATHLADHAVAVNPKKKKGWFWNKKEKESKATAADSNNSLLVQDDDDRLTYTEQEGEEEEDSSLLYTSSLDVANIPGDAHAVARRVLSGRTPNVARTSWEVAGSACLVVTGLGTLMESCRSTSRDTSASSTVQQQQQQQHTSDRHLLLAYAKERDEPYSVAQARAAMIGPNLLVVSWGFRADAVVVFYRRCGTAVVGVDSSSRLSSRDDDDDDSSFTWDAVAVVTATAVVQEHLGDVFLEDADSALLAASDLVPLVVELDDQAPAATLAVARLGGFIELVPLPLEMWYGPVLQQQTQIKKGRRGGGKRKPGEHYAAALLGSGKDLSRSSGITALTTADYHSDVIGLQALRTSLNANQSVEWDQERYPAAPPAEFVLAAHGSQRATTGTGTECITFWSVSTILNDQGSFSLHATLTEALDFGGCGVGPDVTLFATPAIFRYWRKPRQVALRVESPTSVSGAAGAAEPKSQRVTTLSVPAPIVDLSFLVTGQGSSLSVRAAVQDWNGGCTILDCDLLEKAVSHRMSEHEHGLVYQEDPEEGVALVKVVQTRSQCVQQIAASCDSVLLAPPRIRSVQWFDKPKKAGDSNVALAVLVDHDNACSLRLVFSLAFGGSENHGSASDDDDVLHYDYKTSVIPCAKGITGSLHRFGGKNKKLYLAFQSPQSKDGKEYTSLNFCALQELSPGDIVQSFVRTSKFREAIAASENLTIAEQDTISDDIEKCKRQLWESELDFAALESVKDEAYIVKQALHSHPKDGCSVSLYRSICRLALKRIQTVRLGAALAIAGSMEEAKAVADDIQNRLIKLGTYEIICEYLSCVPSFGTFLDEFLHVPPIDLAQSFARSADLFPLSVIYLRHQKEFSLYRFEVLDQIPLSLAPTAYQHLLPVQEEGTPLVVLFMSGAKPYQILEFPELPAYMSRRFDCEAVIDEEDEILVVADNVRVSSEPEATGNKDSPSLEEWYARRALAIQSFVSSLGHLSAFSSLALCALRVDCADAASSASSPSVATLSSLVRFADSVGNIQPDKNDRKLLSSLATLGLEGFAEMNTSELVAIIMNCKGESVDLYARYSQYLLPMLKEKISVRDDRAFQLQVDNAMKTFCTSLVGEAAKDNDLVDAVKLCSRIVWSSRTSIDIASRLLKDRSVLLSLVMAVVDKVSKSAGTMELGTSSRRAVVNALWKMYESLPTTLPPGQDSVEGQGCLMKEVDLLYKDLIFLDIAAQWQNTNSFAMFLEKRAVAEMRDKDDSVRQTRIGASAVVALCRSFCEQVQINPEQDNLSSDVSAMLSSLLGDIKEINQACFENAIAVKDLVTKHVFRPLLQHQQISLLGEFLSHAEANLVDSEAISREVQLFFNDAVYGSRGTEDGSSLRAAIECQDVLGSFLPELRREFQASRKYLDAAHHINTVLLSNEADCLGPEKVRKMFPLDVIDYVLEKNPSCVIQNCVEWANAVWAKQANEDIRFHLHHSQMSMPGETPSPVSKSPPPLPGKALFHLAQLLGLDEHSSVIAVKSRAIHHANLAGLYGAAAALCRTLDADTAAFDTDSAPLLDGVAKVVSRKGFDDIATKRELCSSVLVRHSANLSSTKSMPFDAIMQVWNRIEDGAMDGRTGGPIDSVSQLFHDTRTEYSTEMGELFSTLHCQVSDCVVDDALLVALARYSTFWCIGRSTRPKLLGVGAFETPSTKAVVALAASYLLQIQDKGAFEECLGELRQIFDNEQSVALNSIASSNLNWAKPDATIVTGLIGRGYSECGARRSAGMTRNVGFDQALQFAVMHSLDDGFDDPVAVIRSGRDIFVDEQSARALDHTLEAIESVQSGFETLESALASAGVADLIDTGEEPHENGFHTTPTKGLTPIQSKNSPDLEKETAVLETNAPASPPAKTSAVIASTEGLPAGGLHIAPRGSLKVAGAGVGVLKVPSKGTLKVAVAGKLKATAGTDLKVRAKGKGNATLQVPTKNSVNPPATKPTLTVPAVPPKGEVPLSEEGVNLSAKPTFNDVLPATKPTLKVNVPIAVPPAKPLPKKDVPAAVSPAKAPLKIEIPSPARSSRIPSAVRRVATPSRGRLEASPNSAPSPERTALLQVGQAAFQSTRTSSPSPASEERKRLIAEGRLLLQRARSSSAEPKLRYAARSPKPPAPPPKPAARAATEPAPAPAPAPAPPIAASVPEPGEDGDEWDFDDDLDL